MWQQQVLVRHRLITVRAGLGTMPDCMAGRSHLPWQQREALHGVNAVVLAPQQACDLFPGAQGDACLRWLLRSNLPQLGAGALACCTLLQVHLQCGVGAPACAFS